MRQRPAGDLGVDHRRPAGGRARRERVLELLERLDAVAVRPAGPGVRGEVRVLELDQAGLVVGRQLVDLDELELLVVEDRPR